MQRGKLSSAEPRKNHSTFFECLYGALSAAAGPSLAYSRDKQQGRIWRRITQEVHKIKIGRGPLLPCIISQSHADRGHSIYKIPAAPIQIEFLGRRNGISIAAEASFFNPFASLPPSFLFAAEYIFRAFVFERLHCLQQPGWIPPRPPSPFSAKLSVVNSKVPIYITSSACVRRPMCVCVCSGTRPPLDNGLSSTLSREHYWPKINTHSRSPLTKR